MKRCTKCSTLKDESSFYKRGDGTSLRSSCIECCRGYAKEPARISKVSDWRREVKERLIAHHGSRCVDCGYSGPPYQLQFDHREPDTKSFQISEYGRGYAKLLAESLKCDLVCTMCHNERTHRQRCTGCTYCS